MYVDARALAADASGAADLRAGTCIVGAGVAGIALARTLGRAGHDVLVLESGAQRLEPATAGLGRAESLGVAYPTDVSSRIRMLGGNSNLWGGWSRPFEPDDLAGRPWVADSGWPIGYDELARHYPSAQDLLDVGSPHWDTAYWADAVARPDVRVLGLPHDEVVTSFSQFSGRHRIGERYSAELGRSERVRVVLHATAVSLEASDGRVRAVSVRTPEGRPLRVSADRFVLAGGGIENPRLLLASGLGGELVGRYFADHPRRLLGRLRPQGALIGNRLYDLRTQDRRPGITVDGTAVAAHFVLPPEVREREQLLGARVWLRSRLVAEERPGVLAVRALRAERRLGGRGTAHLGPAARDPLGLAAYAVARAVPAVHRRPVFEVIAEQSPDPASRITLSDRRDPHGVPLPRIDWRLGDDVGRTLHRTTELVAAALTRAGAATCVVPPPEGDWRNHVLSTWHPMGTTRMAVDPAHGVVDPDAKVFGLANLYLAGSSVFPTTGTNFPTLTLTALALRLAEHLASI